MSEDPLVSVLLGAISQPQEIVCASISDAKKIRDKLYRRRRAMVRHGNVTVGRVEIAQHKATLSLSHTPAPRIISIGPTP